MLPTSESSEPLSVIILTDTATRQVFNQSLNDESSTLHITILDSLELALKMGYKGKYADLPILTKHFICMILLPFNYRDLGIAKTTTQAQ